MHSGKQKIRILPRLGHIDPTNQIDLKLSYFREQHFVTDKNVTKVDQSQKTIALLRYT